MKYNKLVRDRIPEYIKSRGGKAIIHFADEQEYWLKLKEKLEEEVNEFIGAENEEEMADILEVIDAIVEYKKFSKGNILSIKKRKLRERGGFVNRAILDET